ncbi:MULTISPECIES: recombinase family protein [unclassified Lysobacter]|uniref:recombinase family protein n=1 Tax=unclassified Lysobacter TaxID=2635362 RepID=UPI001BEAE2A5|nr:MULTISPECIES: recombinase family protein [unclassified Lysobacter]MBT2746203.1 recombinase family protein [Lysobacter sp. ISL-42]MBT2750748.1 recombinase family protein [Lysobacter sp. ISL-50]MBT2776105.1 recombinase family protein [Lysobacter sp. ISL-54]MBT2784611.1 recombinase family protein [Lysobacter sp. ISL-52]
MTPPLTIATYIRTSTHSSEGVAQQIRLTNRFLRTQLGVTSSTIYCDDGYSGVSLERPSLQSLLADVKAGRVDTIVVSAHDRLTRVHTHLLSLQMHFEQARVALLAATPLPRGYLGNVRLAASIANLFDDELPQRN